MNNLFWFKNDLRVSDNPGLSAAVSSGTTCAVYCLAMRQWQKHGVSIMKQSLILRRLLALSHELDQLNIPLKVIDVGSFDELPARLSELVQNCGAKQVFWNKEIEVNEARCEEQVAAHLREIGVKSRPHDETCLVSPGTIRNGSGEPYKVFSAFKRAFESRYRTEIRPIYAAPAQQAVQDAAIQVSSAIEVRGLRELDLEALKALEAGLQVHLHYSAYNLDEWPVSEEAVHQRLNHFAEDQIASYHTQRDIPSIQGTSELSPYLASGIISARQCWQVLESRFAVSSVDPSDKVGGHNTWANELLWREFYKHLLFEQPRLCKFKPYRLETDQLQWRHNKELFEAWTLGKTGYPFVDAGMRQLNQTGWMHNRLRMVTAMFLTKHLFVDWRWGEAYFMSKLIDGDLAANNGGWQWCASTGVDAVPYFRIFNPVRQSQRFDPEGLYIKKFVPELRDLDARSIHMPTSGQALERGYVLPLVSHAEAVASTKLAFSKLDKRQNMSPQMELNCI